MHNYFSIEAFEKLQPHWRLTYFPETDSTNEQAKQAILNASKASNASQASKQFTSGAVFLADQQSCGKGRRDNTWSSSPGEDLLFTVVIETELALDQVHKVATATALALVKVLEKNHLCPKIKFPNDVYLDGKKTAGILIEQIKQFTLIGIGINVNSQPELENSTSLIQQSGSPISREKFLASLLDQLLMQVSLCKKNYHTIQTQITPYDLFFQQTIQYTEDNTTYTGIAQGISLNGYILVDSGNGPQEVFSGHSFRLL
ncbi:biotin--[acetyl-CoA-carboxylase] ligase [Akkermansiaceae bacterium]|nr:biotin--[acetyl-CoA-carboxylase] ligase [Akkermansiaceae bacterium]